MASYSMVNASIDDSEAISSLLQAAKRGGLAPSQRIKLGYVQGDMSLGLVRRRFERGFGALIAVDDSTGEIVGVNFYSDAPSDTQVKHPLAGVASSLQGFQEDGRIDEAGYPIRFDNTMMYGPMAVADHASGKDLARKLIEGMVPIAQQRADARIISFVDNANSASIAVHRWVGLSSLTEFEFEGRPYTLFSRNV